jgi:predicted DNA binding protein
MLIAEYWTDGPFLKEALETAPGMAVETEEQYATDGTERYLFWAEGGDFAAFERGLDADPTVGDATVLTEAGSRRLYRVDVADDAEETSMRPTLADLDVVLLDGEGTEAGWTARMRFPDREALARLQDAYRARGFPFEVRMIYRGEGSRADADALLTAKQREALVAAYERGHFDVPRRASQGDLAAQFDVSTQAVSERLRRGTATLVEATLGPSRE